MQVVANTTGDLNNFVGNSTRDYSYTINADKQITQEVEINDAVGGFSAGTTTTTIDWTAFTSDCLGLANQKW